MRSVRLTVSSRDCVVGAVVGVTRRGCSDVIVARRRALQWALMSCLLQEWDGGRKGCEGWEGVKDGWQLEV